MKIFSRLLPDSPALLKVAALGVAAWSVLLGSCSQTPITVTLHALQASEKVSFVCHGADNGPTGHKLDECPDYTGNDTRHVYSLVTQTATDEVAVIDLQAQVIVDDDPATPGYSFLRVGARPGAIVTTPGGAATFVGVSGPTKNGVFALPSTCIDKPLKGQPARDLTSWSACHLSSAPGDISVVLDATQIGDAQRASCSGDVQPSSSDLPQAQQDYHLDCPADVTHEAGPPGRRKLLVALPDEHKLVLLDAQRLLDVPPGEFPDCTIDHEYALNRPPPTSPVSPVLPDDLKPISADSNLCLETVYPAPASTEATPAGLASSGDTVYIADRTQPVIHRLDMADPCVTKELDPLLPHSYLTPLRTVTTSRLAVSPLSPTGKQYVYAVDDQDQPASLMVFDVTPGGVANAPTPIVFPGSPRQPYGPPDRLRFSAPVRDVNFVQRDFPTPDPDSGVGQYGLACSPLSKDDGKPAASYRPNADFTLGARPFNLRGMFAFAMLTNGSIAVIDVEDFDAPCRRPVATNSSPFPDFRGCANDPGNERFYTDDNTESGVPKVTNESSCNMIEPHHARAASLSLNSGIVSSGAPTLRAFPTFTNPNPASVLNPEDQPRMVAVNFPNPDPSNPKPVAAQVNVSASTFTACGSSDSTTSQDCLGLNPKVPGVRNSLTLPLVEPRSYAPTESLALTFEGRVLPPPPPPLLDRTSGFFKIPNPPNGTAVLSDPDSAFCTYGVQDADAIAEEAKGLGIQGITKEWATAHADYVQLTGDFPPDVDSYWTLGAGQSCQAMLNDTVSNGNRASCEAMFGKFDDINSLLPTRDLEISAAFSDHLQVKPRQCGSDEDCITRMAQIHCCFPSGSAYTVRASKQWVLTGTAGLHDIATTTTADGPRCQHTASCDRRKQYFHQRVFELCTPDDSTCKIGNTDVACVTNPIRLDGGQPTNDPPVNPGGVGSACIFNGLTSRFAVYRGDQPSVRDMAFSWQTVGGYTPLSMTLLPQTTSVNPQSISYLPEFGYIAVIDGSTLGLTLFDLNSLNIVLPSPYF